MRPRLAIISHPLLRETFQEHINHKKINDSVLYYEAFFEELPETIAKIKRERDIDVIVTGSGYSNLIHRSGIPVISVKITGFDVLNALSEAKRKSNRVVFMRYGTPYENIEKYSETVNMDIVSACYINRDDARARVKEFMSAGYDTFIGSCLTNDVAFELGGNPICYYSKDSVGAALDDGYQLAFSRRTEIERREQLNTILEQARQGIIAVNQRLNCVLINSEAEKILAVDRAAVLHKPVSELWPLKKINECLEKAKSMYQVVEKVHNKKFLVDYNINFVKRSISGIIITFQDISAVQQAEQVVRRNLYEREYCAEYRFSDIVGNSEAITNTINLARMFAKNDSTVLISGESGTGKELFAQSIHAESERAQKPFIAINCAALSETLLESELFGYEEGAFTGAKKGGKPGLFEIAHQGTLYLDEIGEISLEMQSRLLRVLQEKKIRRVGGRTWTNVDVRIIAATNRDIKRMVSEGSFREDLYYRLNVLRLFVPPLRERIEDLPELVSYFCYRYKAVHGRGLIVERIMDQSKNYQWPGNIRELENIVQRLVVAQQCESKEEQESLAQLTFSDLKQDIEFPPPKGPHLLQSALFISDFREHKRQLEREYILSILERFNGNKTKTAEYLGVSRSTLWKKLNT